MLREERLPPAGLPAAPFTSSQTPIEPVCYLGLCTKPIAAGSPCASGSDMALGRVGLGGAMAARQCPLGGPTAGGDLTFEQAPASAEAGLTALSQHTVLVPPSKRFPPSIWPHPTGAT